LYVSAGSCVWQQPHHLSLSLSFLSPPLLHTHIHTRVQSSFISLVCPYCAYQNPRWRGLEGHKMPRRTWLQQRQVNKSLSTYIYIYIYISLSHTHTHALSHTHIHTHTHTRSVVIHISCLPILYVPESEGQMAVGRDDAEVGMAATTAGEQVSLSLSLSLSHTYTRTLCHTHTHIHTRIHTRVQPSYISLVCPYCAYQNPKWTWLKGE